MKSEGSSDMTRKEFDILTYLDELREKPSQRSIAAGVGVSVGTVNKTLAALHQREWITPQLSITGTGYAALEPYRAKRAIFLAAGVGDRLLPITLNTPKPLIRVHGARILDSAIDACLAAGIEEIYIVRGYLSEQFDQLLAKYPMIRFLENPAYSETNNISSAMCARYLLKNAYVMEADLIINNKSVIRKYHYTSNCLGVPVEMTDDWCVTRINGYASQLTLGGTNCHHLFSIYYFNEEEGGKLPAHIEAVYQSPGGKQRFWDLVPLTFFSKEYHVEITECTLEDVTEIDTLRELQAVDRAYATL